MSGNVINRVRSTQATHLRKQILVAQGAAMLTVLLPSLLLGGKFVRHSIVAALLFILTAIYLCVVYWDRLGRKKNFRLDAVARYQRFRSHLGWLIFVDLWLISAVVGLSGGVIDSQIGPMLLLAPAIVAFVRGGGNTMLYTGLGMILFTVMEGFSKLWAAPKLMPSNLCADSVTQLFGVMSFSLEHGNASREVNYPIAVCAAMVVGIILTIIQDRLSTGRALPDRIKEEEAEKIAKAFSPALDEDKLGDLVEAVDAAHRDAGRLISLTNEPELHQSVVHPINDTVFQAMVLGTLGFETSPGTVKKCAKMVFLAHWVDDMFDRLGYEKLGQNMDLQAATTNKIAKLYNPFGIKRVINQIKRDAVWEDGAETGLLCIILGGFVRHQSPKKQEALNKIQGEIMRLAHDEGLRAILKAAPPKFYWGVSKVAMPLIVSMFCNPDDGRPQLKSQVVALDALFLPLMIWQDLPEEFNRELCTPGEHPDTFCSREHISGAVKSALEVIKWAREHNLLEKDTSLWKGMSPVLKAVYDNYCERLPNEQPYIEYRQIVESMLGTPVRPRPGVKAETGYSP